MFKRCQTANKTSFRWRTMLDTPTEGKAALGRLVARSVEALGLLGFRLI